MTPTKTIVVLLAALAALPLAIAQGPAPDADAADAAVGTRGVGATLPLRTARGAATNEDPRICLEFPTNLQVIACAEKYLPRPRRAAGS
jgi:hypothetical protein